MSGTNSLFTVIDPCFGYHDDDDACRAAGLNPNYADKFRIDDLMDTAVEMGLAFVRIRVPSAGSPKGVEPVLNQFNDEAFNNIDYHIKAAKNRNLRIILTLVDNYDDSKWIGGKYAFLRWRGFLNDENGDFFFNPTIISDYKNYISYVLNHVNPLTGIAYKDDSTIMAFETGNELVVGSIFQNPNAPSIKSWTETIASHIKSIAPNHLVLDGTEGGGSGRTTE